MTTTPSLINLTPSQARFALMVDDFPRVSQYWNWERPGCDVEGIRNAMGTMSHGEKILAEFFLSVWTHENHGFSILEAGSTLDQKGRQVIIDWLTDPLWP